MDYEDDSLTEEQTFKLTDDEEMFDPLLDDEVAPSSLDFDEEDPESAYS